MATPFLLAPIPDSNQRNSKRTLPRQPVFSSVPCSNPQIPFTVDSQHDINFIDKLRSSRGDFMQQLPRTQPQQNTLIRLCSILHNNLQPSVYSDIFLIRLGQILRTLGERLQLKQPMCHFIQFNMDAVLQFVGDRQLKQPYRSIAVSVLGLHPPIHVTQQNYQSLPLFIIPIRPDNPNQACTVGNRNWRRSRFVLEKKAQRSEFSSDEAQIIYGWLLGRLPEYFSSLSWVHDLYKQLFEYYYAASMEKITKIYECQITNIDRTPSLQPGALLPPFNINYKDIHNRVSKLDHLSLLIIDVLIQNGNYQQLIKEMLYFAPIEQYEHGLQLALAILYHCQPSDQIKLKLIQLGQKLNNIEAILPLVSENEQQIISYYDRQRVDQPTRFSMYRDNQLKSRLAETFWQKNKQKVLELRQSLSESVFPLKILESINIMDDINDIQKALEALKDKNLKVKVVNDCSRLLQQWKQLADIIKNKKSSNDQSKEILKLLSSSSKQVAQSELKPARFVKRWLIAMLLRVIDSALKNKKQQLTRLAKQSFAATQSYIADVVDEETLEKIILPKMAELLIQDQVFLQELL